jgi:hypothetical protein
VDPTIYGPVFLLFLFLSGIAVWWDLTHRYSKADKRLYGPEFRDSSSAAWDNCLIWPSDHKDLDRDGFLVECRACGWKWRVVDSGVRVGTVVDTVKGHMVTEHGHKGLG